MAFPTSATKLAQHKEDVISFYGWDNRWHRKNKPDKWNMGGAEYDRGIAISIPDNKPSAEVHLDAPPISAIEMEICIKSSAADLRMGFALWVGNSYIDMNAKTTYARYLDWWHDNSGQGGNFKNDAIWTNNYFPLQTRADRAPAGSPMWFNVKMLQYSDTSCSVTMESIMENEVLYLTSCYVRASIDVDLRKVEAIRVGRNNGAANLSEGRWNVRTY